MNQHTNFACPIYTENINGVNLAILPLFVLIFPLVFMNSKLFLKKIYLESFDMNVGNSYHQSSSNDKKIYFFDYKHHVVNAV